MVVFHIIALIGAQFLLGIFGANSPYRIYDMVPEGICKTRRIPLLDNLLTQGDPFRLTNPEQGAIFRQVWNSSSFKRFSDCKLYLQAPMGMGLYLTISKAVLRKNSKGSCLDQITVKKSNEKKYKFCDAQDDDELRVYSDTGKMRVTVNLETTLALPSLDDTLEVQFIVTVNRPCRNNLEGYKSCEGDDDDDGDEDSEEDREDEMCISKAFFGDGFVNCPGCTDEKGCFKDSATVQILNPSNVLLSAIISLFATMIVFGGCLWCLYRNRHCIGNCNSNSAGGVAVRNNREAAGMATVDQIQVELHSSAADVLPSAPPDDDKDLPPSYETLFPANPSGR